MVSRFFRCLFPVWRPDPVQETILPIVALVSDGVAPMVDTRVNMNILAMTAYQRHVARFYMKQRNLFQDRLEKVLLMIQEASLHMKEKHARVVFHVCLANIQHASMEMKQKRAMHLFSLVLPVVQRVAQVKHQHRLDMQRVGVHVHAIGGVKTNQRMNLDRVLRVEFPVGIQERKNREKMRLHFHNVVLSSMMEVVYMRQMSVERIRYANVWECIMSGIRLYKKPMPKQKREMVDYFPYMILMGAVFLFWLCVFGASCLFWNVFVCLMNQCHFMGQCLLNRGYMLLMRLEQMYEKNQPGLSRQEKRRNEKLEKKMRKKQHSRRSSIVMI